MIEIVKLTDKSSPYFKTICDWMYNWWSNGWDYNQVKLFMENSLEEEKISQTYIALKAKEVVGMFQINMNDLIFRPDLYPWLSNVYVDENSRNQGICKAMMLKAIEVFKELRLDTVYLHTKHQDLYEKYGWEFIEEVDTFIEDKLPKRIYKHQVR